MATKSKAKGYRKLLGVVRSGGEWIAVFQRFGVSSERDPIIAGLCPVAALKGPQRRKADRWLAELA